MSPLFLQLAIALGLGLLVGLQRERVEARLAGIRTFALVTMAGTLSGVLAQSFGGWVIAAGMVVLGALMVVGNLAKIKSGEIDPGLTTEIALLLMFCVGAYLSTGNPAVAIVVGGAVAVVLYLKPELHRLAHWIADDDFRAVMQFTLLALVILPVLPDQTFGPYAVLNPREIWWMVVLIVGLGLAGYIAYKVFGHRGGTLLAGLLGGAISSTATTVSNARRTAAQPGASETAALVVLIASGMVFLRLMIEIAAVAPAFLPTAAVPLATMLAALALAVLALWRRSSADAAPLTEAENPSELKPALLFAALYALILLAVEAARQHLGSSGLYAVAALSGLTDMDAITLSTSKLVGDGRVAPVIGAKAILLASLSNLAFKGGIALFFGSPRFKKRVALAFGAVSAVGVALLLAW